MNTKRFSFMLLLLVLLNRGVNLFAQTQPSIVLTSSDLKLVSDANTKIVLSDINLVNNAHADVISGNPEIIYAGNNPISFGGSYNTNLDKLTVNNASGLSLANSITVNSELKLSNGHLKLEDKNLTLGPSATIAGTPNASNMIVASGTGELRKGFASGTYTSTNSPAPFTFPVGTTAGGNEYTPVTLDFTSGTFGSSAEVGVRVHDSKNASLNASITNYLNRNWIVEPTNDITNFNYTIELKYVDADFVTDNSLTESDLFPIKISGSTWYQPTDGPFSGSASLGFADLVNTSTNIIRWSDLNSFSQFGGAGGSGQPLPVELVSFTGNCDNGIINLSWQTASEFNSSHFDIEESRDGTSWLLLDTRTAAGNSNELINYYLVDKSTNNGNNYYRIQQFDQDGQVKTYGPINVTCEETLKGYLSSFPNPSGSAFQVVVNNKELIGASTLNITDSKGSQVYHSNIELKNGINMFVVSENLAPGVYFIRILNGTKSTEVIRHTVK